MGDGQTPGDVRSSAHRVCCSLLRPQGVIQSVELVCHGSVEGRLREIAV